MSKKRNRREARQYAFQVLYANEFHTSNDDVIFPDGEISLSMDIAYANQIIDGVLSILKKSTQYLNHIAQNGNLYLWIK